MERILEQMFYGNINPNDKQFDKNSQFAKSIQILCDNEEKLIELLDGKEQKLLLELVNAQSEVNGITAVESFINGFRLGAKIMLEILEDDKSCFKDIV